MKKEAKIKENRDQLCKRSSAIMKFNHNFVSKLTERWKKAAFDLDFLGKQKKNRDSFLKNLLANADSTKNYDKNMVTQIVRLWSDEAERRREPDTEDISIIFHALEISREYVKPTIKIEVKVLFY